MFKHFLMKQRLGISYIVDKNLWYIFDAGSQLIIMNDIIPVFSPLLRWYSNIFVEKVLRSHLLLPGDFTVM